VGESMFRMKGVLAVAHSNKKYVGLRTPRPTCPIASQFIIHTADLHTSPSSCQVHLPRGAHDLLRVLRGGVGGGRATGE
jgi:hypothetical protein